MPGCKRCNGNVKKCQACYVTKGWELDIKAGVCKPCPVKCSECKNGVCTRCDYGYSLMKDKSCLKCARECRECKGNGSICTEVCDAIIHDLPIQEKNIIFGLKVAVNWHFLRFIAVFCWTKTREWEMCELPSVLKCLMLQIDARILLYTWDSNVCRYNLTNNKKNHDKRRCKKVTKVQYTGKIHCKNSKNVSIPLKLPLQGRDFKHFH